MFYAAMFWIICFTVIDSECVDYSIAEVPFPQIFKKHERRLRRNTIIVAFLITLYLQSRRTEQL